MEIPTALAEFLIVTISIVILLFLICMFFAMMHPAEPKDTTPEELKKKGSRK